MVEVMNMVADMEYRYFQTFMEEERGRYDPTLFSQDIMYFCKIWKSRRYEFAQYCKRHDLVRAYILLNQRCVEYECMLLERKHRFRQIDEQEYRNQLRVIEKVYL